MSNQTTWQHFQEITECIKRIKNNVSRLKTDISRLKSMKETILDDVEFKAKLKKVIDVYPGATMESLIADYIQFQALRDWLEANGF